MYQNIDIRGMIIIYFLIISNVFLLEICYLSLNGFYLICKPNIIKYDVHFCTKGLSSELDGTAFRRMVTLLFTASLKPSAEEEFKLAVATKTNKLFKPFS